MDDSALAIACPLLYAGKKAYASMSAARKRREDAAAGIYGGGFAGFDLAAVFMVLVWIAVIGGLWLYPMVKAFRCPKDGVMWGLLILLFPFLGIIYLFVGCHPDAAAVGES